MKSKVGPALIILSVILNICLIIAYVNYVSNDFAPKPGYSSKTYLFDSNPITSTEADGLIDNYKTSDHILKTLKKNQQAALFEFCFGADQINEIINQNGSNTTPGNVEQVALYFGFDAPYSANTVVRHLVAYGMVSPYHNIPHTGGKVLDFFSGANNHASIFETSIQSYVLKGTAEQSRRYYYTKTSTYIPLYTFDYDNRKKELDGFSFNARQINQILNVEHPDTVAFAIGLERPFTDTSKIRWHLIAYGKRNGSPINTAAGITDKKNNNTLINAEIYKVTNTNPLPASALYFDKADPCPKCVPK